MRYVFNTTGPYAMRRFLNLPANAAKLQKLKYLECNYFKDAASLNENQKRVLDVISYPSQSYFTKEHEIRVPVGPGTKQLQPLPTTKRMRTKMCVRLVEIPQSVQQPDPTNATRNEESQNARGVDTASSGVASGSDRRPEPPLQTHSEKQPENHTACGAAAASNPIKETLDKEDRDRIDELRQWFRIHRMSISVKTVLEDMTDKLRSWVQEKPRKD